jgi:hypothetical protein
MGVSVNLNPSNPMTQTKLQQLHTLFAEIAKERDLEVGLCAAIAHKFNLSCPDVYRLWEEWQAEE